MFSGIIEAQSKVLEVTEKNQAYGLTVHRPTFFDCIVVGHSVAIDGVCLTVESLTKETITLTAGHETLRVTQWSANDLKKRLLNIERSLKVGERLHGHWVLGHVDTVGILKEKEPKGASCLLKFSLPIRYAPFIWSKGSIAINGVSLTINESHVSKENTQEPDKESLFSVSLIPQTLETTNLSCLEVGDSVNVELDTLAKGVVRGVWFWEKMKAVGHRKDSLSEHNT